MCRISSTCLSMLVNKKIWEGISGIDAAGNDKYTGAQKGNNNTNVNYNCLFSKIGL